MFLPLVAVVVTVGCASSFRETHFFKSESQRDGISNYFRLAVSGHTFLCSSRYISGYFDEDIVNQYFNEIGQPDKGRLLPVGQTPQTDPSNPSEGKNDVAPTSSVPAQGLKNPALVLLLSSNSDEISNQLGALTQSEEFATSFARLMSSSRFEGADDAERRLRNDQARGRLLAATGDQLVTGLPDKPTSNDMDAVSTHLLAFVNQIGADLGAPVPFPSLDEAAAWLDQNRARLREENRP